MYNFLQGEGGWNWYLIGKGGLMDGGIFTLKFNDICIGTDPNSCSVIYPEGMTGISKLHCKLSNQNGGWFLTDFSEAGTWLNGIRLEKGKAVSVKAGDEFILANSENIFLLKYAGTVMIEGSDSDKLPDKNDTQHQQQSIQNKKDTTIKEKFFRYDGRLNRKPYIYRGLFLGFLNFVINSIIIVFLIVSRAHVNETEMIAICYAISIPFMFPGIMLGVVGKVE